MRRTSARRSVSRLGEEGLVRRVEARLDGREDARSFVGRDLRPRSARDCRARGRSRSRNRRTSAALAAPLAVAAQASSQSSPSPTRRHRRGPESCERAMRHGFRPGRRARCPRRRSAPGERHEVREPLIRQATTGRANELEDLGRQRRSLLEREADVPCRRARELRDAGRVRPGAGGAPGRATSSGPPCVGRPSTRPRPGSPARCRRRRRGRPRRREWARSLRSAPFPAGRPRRARTNRGRRSSPRSCRRPPSRTRGGHRRTPRADEARRRPTRRRGGSDGRPRSASRRGATSAVTSGRAVPSASRTRSWSPRRTGTTSPMSDRPGAGERVSREARAVVLDDCCQRGRAREVGDVAVGRDRWSDGDPQRRGRRIERHGRPERLARNCQERRRGRSDPEREVERDPSRRLPQEERPCGHDVAAVVDALPDDEPSVFDGVRGIELILLHVPADQRADVGPQVIGQLVGPSIRLRQQVQASGALEQQVRPGVAGVRRRSQPAHRPTQPARLRVHEPGAHRVPEAIALAARAVEAAPHQVAQPPVELVDARRDLPFARCDPFGARFGVDLGCAFRPGGGGGRSTGAAVQPGSAPSQVDRRLVPHRPRPGTGGPSACLQGILRDGQEHL